MGQVSIRAHGEKRDPPEETLEFIHKIVECSGGLLTSSSLILMYQKIFNDPFVQTEFRDDEERHKFASAVFESIAIRKMRKMRKIYHARKKGKT